MKLTFTWSVGVRTQIIPSLIFGQSEYISEYKWYIGHIFIFSARATRARVYGLRDVRSRRASFRFLTLVRMTSQWVHI